MQFIFKAKAPDGKIIKGKVEAESVNDVKSRLRASNYQPISITSSKNKKSNFDLFQKSVSAKDFQVFLRQLSVLLKSGVPLLDSLKSLQETSVKTGMGDTLKFIIKDVEEGRTLSDAMLKHPRVFNTMTVNLVKAGEQGGILDVVLSRLAAFYEKRQKLQSKVKGALMYPVITIIVAVAALTAILVYVIPKFEQLFQSQGQELPQMTQLVVNMSHFFIAKWYIIVFAFLVVPTALVVLYKMGAIRYTVDTIMIRMPLFGSLVKKSTVARMSRTLATLLKSGIRINDSIDITIGTMGNVVVDGYLVRIRDEIITGKPFSDPLRATRFFPPIVTQMVSIGEKTGNLDNMLERVADFYEDEVEVAAEQLTGLLEPLVMVFLGGLIGFLVVAMFLPIFNLGNAIGA